MTEIEEKKERKIKKEKKLGRRDIETIGRLLPKKQGYYDWCIKHNIDPDSGVTNGKADKKEQLDNSEASAE